MSELFDVVVVGGGPAGLATAIAVAQRGMSAVVLERHSMPTDKACGEGLMPPALTALEALGARRVAQIEDWWVMEDPCGNEFCVIPVVSENFTALANVWESG